MRSRTLQMIGAGAAGAGYFAYTLYRKEIEAAFRRVETGRQLLETPEGPIEFAEAGDGPPVLAIHGAGGGFDQGLALGRVFLGEHYRVIAPSRFGYLGTPLPTDASPEAQADAHLRLLDALQLETVVVVGVSAGAPSAMQLCLRHPERCTALVLSVPMAFLPNRSAITIKRAPSFVPVLNAIVKSDFLFWTAMRVAHATLVKTILGTPVDVYRNASVFERRAVDEILRLILPISRRADGIRNDSIVADTLPPYALENIHVPTLVMSAADDLYGTYEPALYTAEQIHNGRFVGYQTGGHLLVGHAAEAAAEVREFLDACLRPEKEAAATA